MTDPVKRARELLEIGSDCWTCSEEKEAIGIFTTLCDEVERLRGRISRAMQCAHGRWYEWGSRAESVAEILNGEDGEDDDTD